MTLRRAAAFVVTLVSATVGVASAAPPPVALPAHSAAIPAEGNVTLVRLTLVVKPTPGHAIPKSAAVHVFIGNADQLPGAVVLSGGAVSRRTHGQIHYDGFLALLNRTGGGQSGAAPSLFLAVQGVTKRTIRTASSFQSHANALGKRLPRGFCSAAANDTRRPTAIGFVDNNAGDASLTQAARLTLARSSASLCNGGSGAVTRVNSVLQQLGGGLIGPGSAAFTPQTLAGTWRGTWTDTRFGTSGAVTLSVVASATSFTFNLNLGGNVFGCSPPPPTGGTVTAGSGANHWDANGFTLQITGPQGGTIAIAYDARMRTLKGNGRPGCRPGVTWTLQGTFSGNAFTGSVTTTLEDGSTAPANIKLARSSS